ncbi:MAG: hypothetical protein CMJ20_01835 [Phycisphaeraceae bacterium]|nr:hypothetical protein [Phycisphaeraceae bacterium]|tara:strand:- start:5753 stop:6469 length:717 start_codon:yes stop_codon:yes gene_type:complete
MSIKITQQSFLKDVRSHVMTIKVDEGNIRQILFKQPNTSNRYFQITTWDNHLCISGDMGTYVFSRLNDMFNFFRTNTLSVNYGYWGEKLESVSRFGGHYEFDSELVSKSIKDRTDEMCKEMDDYYDCASEDERERYETPAEMAEAFRKEVKDHFRYADLDEHRYVSELESFESSVAECLKLCGEDWDWEWLNDKRLSYQFQWCCYAIAWAIKQYDRHHNPVIIPSHYQPVMAKRGEQS